MPQADNRTTFLEISSTFTFHFRTFFHIIFSIFLSVHFLPFRTEYYLVHASGTFYLCFVNDADPQSREKKTFGHDKKWDLPTSSHFHKENHLAGETRPKSFNEHDVYGLFTHDCYSGDNVMALKSARNRQSISQEREKTRAKQFSAINACAWLESAACLLDYVNAVLGRNLPPRK